MPQNGPLATEPTPTSRAQAAGSQSLCQRHNHGYAAMLLQNVLCTTDRLSTFILVSPKLLGSAPAAPLPKVRP